MTQTILKTMKQKLLIAFALMANLVSGATAVAADGAIDPDADRIFRDSCKYLADAKSFCVKVEVWKDVVLPNGEKLQTTRTLDVQEHRPGQLRIEVRSPHDSRGFWYQNKTLTMLDRSMNLYGVMEVPGTIDKTLDTVEDRFGIEIPLEDVLVSDPYRNMMDNMETAEDLGKVTVLGVVCDHLAFTGPNADCQVWVADGPKPLPRKCVINLKTKTGSPQITQIFSDWDLTSPIAESVFAFVPPDGASKIVVNPKKADVDDDDVSSAAPAASTKPTDEPAKK